MLLPPTAYRHFTGFIGIGTERLTFLTFAPSGRKSPVVNHRKSKSPLTTERPLRDNLLYQIVRTHPGLPLLNKENPTWRGAARRESYHPVKVFIACILTVAGVPAPASAGTTAEWKGGGGAWENAAMWGGTLPSRTAEARINGTQDKPSEVILTHTNVLVNHLSV